MTLWSRSLVISYPNIIWIYLQHGCINSKKTYTTLYYIYYSSKLWYYKNLIYFGKTMVLYLWFTMEKAMVLYRKVWNFDLLWKGHCSMLNLWNFDSLRKMLWLYTKNYGILTSNIIMEELALFGTIPKSMERWEIFLFLSPMLKESTHRFLCVFIKVLQLYCETCAIFSSSNIEQATSIQMNLWLRSKVLRYKLGVGRPMLKFPICCTIIRWVEI